MFDLFHSLYYQYKHVRLSACRLVFHHLLHLADSIRLFGPPNIFWSYIMERFVGTLGPLVHSRLNPYNNLANAALLMEQLRQIKYTHVPFERRNPNREEDDDDDGAVGGHLGKGKVTKLKPHQRTLLARAYTAGRTLRGEGHGVSFGMICPENFYSSSHI